jgi:translation initiation factor 5B
VQGKQANPYKRILSPINTMSSIRSPIVSVLGHVDHGKSSVLDAIRDTNILATEAGAITQAIGASIIPAETLKKKSGALLEKLGVKLTIPGLLFIDTPGHAAFTSLRKRGGSLADIAVVVVDINEGFKPQTIEAIEILKSAKTPFIVVANKLDLVSRFKKPQDKTKSILSIVNEQDAQVVTTIENKLYEIVGKIHEHFGMSSERFDRVEDFTNQIAIIPISAKEQLGLSELLMVLSALAQKYLEKNLLLEEEGPAKGTILEVKEEQGMGTTLDVIIYNGTLKTGDTIVIGGLNGAIVTHVRALFEPEPHHEMRDIKSSFRPVKSVTAATGVKISGPNIDEVLSGMPILSCEKESTAIEKAKQEVQQQLDTIRVETDPEGIIIKADNIGSLEALSVLLKEKGFKIRRATVGPISKKDVTEAESNYDKNPLHAIILGFNIPLEKSYDRVKIIIHDVIYHIIEDYEKWAKEEQQRIENEQLKDLMRPAKVEILANCIFRQSNPCVMGVEVMDGILKTGMPMMKANGDKLHIIKEMQLKKENVHSADKGKQVAISINNITGGRHVEEGDILYTDISPPTFRELKKHAKLLTGEEKEILKEIAEIKRKKDPLWGL